MSEETHYHERAKLEETEGPDMRGHTPRELADMRHSVLRMYVHVQLAVLRYGVTNIMYNLLVLRYGVTNTMYNLLILRYGVTNIMYNLQF